MFATNTSILKPNFLNLVLNSSNSSLTSTSVKLCLIIVEKMYTKTTDKTMSYITSNLTQFKIVQCRYILKKL